MKKTLHEDSMKLYTATKTDLIKEFVVFEGKTPDYNEYWFWPFFWRLQHELRKQGRIRVQEYFLGSRQISKSTTTAIDLAIGLLQSNYRELYVAPQESQATKFSTIRFGPILHSPKIYQMLFTKGSQLIPKSKRGQRLKFRNETRSKIAVNGSYCNISYSDGSDTARLRGDSADKVIFDEAQDMRLSENHHVALYTMRSSDYPVMTNVGTPLGHDELTQGFEESLKFMYHVQCSHCKKDQTLTSLKNIDVKINKVVCSACGYPLDIFGKGQYIAENPEAEMLGMHANMLMLPSIMNPRSGTWEVIRTAISSKTKSDGDKAEELLGVPSGLSEGLITLADLRALPDLPGGFKPTSLESVLDYVPNVGDILVAGIDWGGDASEGEAAIGKQEFEYINSHTAITISAFSVDHNNGRVHQDLLFEKVFPIENPMRSLTEIKEIIRILHSKLAGVAADFGGGYFPNPDLDQYIALLSHRCTFAKIQQLPALSQPYFHTDSNIIKVIKTDVMTEYMRKVTLKEIRYPHDTPMTEFELGLLTQRQFYDRRGTARWKRKDKSSDDCFMADMFAWLLAISLLGVTHEVFKNPN